MQSQFQLEEQVATLVHINPRPEKHGEENVPAADLKIEVVDSNEILSLIHPSLRGLLYKADDDNPTVDGVEPQPTKLRFGTLIERLRVDTALKGADVVIGFGLGGSSDIQLETVNVDGFGVTLPPSMSVTPAVDKQGSLGLPVGVE